MTSRAPGKPPSAAVEDRVTKMPDVLFILILCCTQKRWKPSPALKRKRKWSKNRSTDGAVSPVSVPSPNTCSKRTRARLKI